MPFLITRSTDGTALITCDPDDLVLREYLEAELINDLAYLRHLKTKITASKSDDFEISGNLFSLTGKNGVFEIINLFDDEEHQTGQMTHLLDVLDAAIAALDNKAAP